MFSRRLVLSSTLAACLVRVAGGPAWAEEGRSTNAFNARSPDSVLGALGLPRKVVDSTDILIEAPDVAENGANVPVEVTVNLPKVERVLLLGEKNIYPLLADVRFQPRVKPWFEVKVKLGETSKLLVLAQADGTLYSASRSVRVIVGGCLPG
jgi:sulfur-oxidizing protein SoxY